MLAASREHQALGLLVSGPGLKTLILGLGIAGSPGHVCSPIDSHHCIEFLAGEFEGGNTQGFLLILPGGLGSSKQNYNSYIL